MRYTNGIAKGILLTSLVRSAGANWEQMYNLEHTTVLHSREGSSPRNTHGKYGFSPTGHLGFIISALALLDVRGLLQLQGSKINLVTSTSKCHTTVFG